MSVINEIARTPALRSEPAIQAASAQPVALNPSRHVPALDGLRGLAVIAVILVHAKVLPHGGIGVDVFFVLSGYLITAILIREKEQTGGFSFKNFYIRRWLRLAPAFFFMIVLFLLLARTTNMSMTYALGDVGIALAYASNWTRALGDPRGLGLRPDYLGHTWSLSVEEQFYLVWPALALAVWWLLRKRWVTGLFFMAAAVGVMRYREQMMYYGASTARVYNGLDTRADALLIGAALAFWMPPVGKILSGVIGWISLAALALFVAQDFYMPVLAQWWGPAWQVRGSYVIPVVSTAGVIVGIMGARGSLMDRGLGILPLAWMGRISYGLYLFHFPWVAYISRIGFPKWQVVAAGMPVTFGFAILSYYWIEMPCLRLKERFRSPAAVQGVVAV